VTLQGRLFSTQLRKRYLDQPDLLSSLPQRSTPFAMLSQFVQTQFPEGGFSVHLDGLDCLVGVALFLTILGVPNLIWKKAYAQCLGRRDEDQFDPRKRDPAGPFMDRTRENSPVRQPWVNYNNNPEHEPARSRHKKVNQTTPG
jgi:hypothetical protein